MFSEAKLSLYYGKVIYRKNIQQQFYPVVNIGNYNINLFEEMHPVV